MTLKYLLLALALIFAAPSPSPRVWTDWHPAPARAFLSATDECEPWHCSYQDGDTLYCFAEGEMIETPGATFVCRCEAQGTDGCTFALMTASVK